MRVETMMKPTMNMRMIFMVLFLSWDFSLLMLQSYRPESLIATLESVYFEDVSGCLNT